MDNLSIGELLNDSQEQNRRQSDSLSASIRVCIPGIIIDFDSEKQTATVQPAIREIIREPGKERHIEKLPLLLDVPVVFPKSGDGYCLTFPVRPNDECLVIFGDMCIDAWWQSSGIQNQIEQRRHDLSDGFAILGVSSVPMVTTNYSTNSLQLRNKDGDTYFEITDDKVINIIARENDINIDTEHDVNVKSAKNIDVKSSKNITIQAAEDIAVHSNNLNMDIDSDSNVHVKADSRLTVDNSIHVTANENIFVSCKKDITVDSAEAINIVSEKELLIESKKGITLKAPKVEIVQEEDE